MSYVCTCGSDKREMHGEVEYAPLESGRHTNFMVLICTKCFHLDFLPKDNYDLFMGVGKDEAIAAFEKSAEELVKNITATQPKGIDKVIAYLKRRDVYWPYAIGGIFIGILIGLVLLSVRG